MTEINQNLSTDQMLEMLHKKGVSVSGGQQQASAPSLFTGTTKSSFGKLTANKSSLETGLQTKTAAAASEEKDAPAVSGMQSPFAAPDMSSVFGGSSVKNSVFTASAPVVKSDDEKLNENAWGGLGLNFSSSAPQFDAGSRETSEGFKSTVKEIFAKTFTPKTASAAPAGGSANVAGSGQYTINLGSINKQTLSNLSDNRSSASAGNRAAADGNVASASTQKMSNEIAQQTSHDKMEHAQSNAESASATNKERTTKTKATSDANSKKAQAKAQGQENKAAIQKPVAAKTDAKKDVAQPAKVQGNADNLKNTGAQQTPMLGKLPLQQTAGAKGADSQDKISEKVSSDNVKPNVESGTVDSDKQEAISYIDGGSGDEQTKASAERGFDGLSEAQTENTEGADRTVENDEQIDGQGANLETTGTAIDGLDGSIVRAEASFEVDSTLSAAKAGAAASFVEKSKDHGVKADAASASAVKADGLSAKALAEQGTQLAGAKVAETGATMANDQMLASMNLKAKEDVLTIDKLTESVSKKVESAKDAATGMEFTTQGFIKMGQGAFKLAKGAVMNTIGGTVEGAGTTVQTMGDVMAVSGDGLVAMGGIPIIGPLLAAAGNAMIAAGGTMQEAGATAIAKGQAMMAEGEETSADGAKDKADGAKDKAQGEKDLSKSQKENAESTKLDGESKAHKAAAKNHEIVAKAKQRLGMTLKKQAIGLEEKAVTSGATAATQQGISAAFGNTAQAEGAAETANIASANKANLSAEQLAQAARETQEFKENLMQQREGLFGQQQTILASVQDNKQQNAKAASGLEGKNSEITAASRELVEDIKNGEDAKDKNVGKEDAAVMDTRDAAASATSEGGLNGAGVTSDEGPENGEKAQGGAEKGNKEDSVNGENKEDKAEKNKDKKAEKNKDKKDKKVEKSEKDEKAEKTEEEKDKEDKKAEEDKTQETEAETREKTDVKEPETSDMVAVQPKETDNASTDISTNFEEIESSKLKVQSI